MSEFKSLDSKNVREREAVLEKYWQDIDLLDETFKTREDAEEYIIFDGPPTANGKPGIHHVIARTLKAVSYTHLRAHETKANLVCRLLLEKKKTM